MAAPVIQPDLGDIIQRISDRVGRLENSQQPDYDSGWFAEEANTSHRRALQHGLGLALVNPPKVNIWFSPTDPALGPPAFVAPMSNRGMWVDDPQTTAMGYSNPAEIRVTPNTVELSIWSGSGLYVYWEAPAGTWRMYQTGFYRVALWR